ncbi:MAG: intracellular sulfur oxidation DsrE/DsrF family protein [Halioglobus sp.]|jgi:intracellular sulfur oxidation DsrE/DsrF family protein
MTCRSSWFSLLLRLPSAVVCLFFTFSIQAQEAPGEISNEIPDYYVAAIELHTTAELHTVLERANQLLADGVALQSEPASITFVLHGPEAKSLLRQNYLQNKATVDLAARLSALGVVDIKACETWMGGNGVNPDNLQPFVGTVNYGPREIRRLVEDEGYLLF